MVKFAAFALVALVAFQACSAQASSSVVDSTYDAVLPVVDQAAAGLFDAVYTASLKYTNFVSDVLSAVLDSDTYGESEGVAKRVLAKIDATVASRAEVFQGFSDAAITQIADIVAQASASAQDNSALLTLIQEKYSKALEAAVDIANDFSENAADAARREIGARPDIREVKLMEDLRRMYKVANKSIERKILKASEQIAIAVAQA